MKNENDKQAAQPALPADPIGVVGTMPGTDGFTMACFKASDVPVGTKLYLAAPGAAQTTDAREEPQSAKQEKLRALADRIDYEKLWQLPLMYRDSLTDAGRDRLDAGIALRRYAELLAPGRWIVFPPTGPVRFSASTLDKAYEMAKRDEERKVDRATHPTDKGQTNE